MSEGENKIGDQLLDKHELKVSVSGFYMKAWNVLVQSKKLPQNLDDYLITFQEAEEEILIYLTKPLKVKMLGGGSGIFKVSKISWEVTEGELAK